MRLVLDERERVCAWVAAHIPDCDRGWGAEAYGIGVEDKGELIGGSVFHGWSPEWGIVEMSSAAVSPRWAIRPMLKGIFGYVFDLLKIRMVVMRTSEKNTRMVSIGRRLGCREYRIDDLRADGEAEIVLTLTAAAWRNFIGEANG